MFLSKILLRRSSKTASKLIKPQAKKRNSQQKTTDKFKVCVPTKDELDSYRALDVDRDKEGLMRAVVVDAFLNKLFDESEYLYFLVY